MKEKVSRATFLSPVPGQCNETADRWDFEVGKAPSVPAAAASASLEHQDLEPLPLLLEESDGLELVKAPRPPRPPLRPPRKGLPPPP